jgi:hypothetical protein
MIENKELEMILSILMILVFPTILGKITNFIFKIKNNNNFVDTWYTGIWSSFFIIILLGFLLSFYTTIIK